MKWIQPDPTNAEKLVNLGQCGRAYYNGYRTIYFFIADQDVEFNFSTEESACEAWQRIRDQMGVI